jgi:hypothetical protein
MALPPNTEWSRRSPMDWCYRVAGARGSFARVKRHKAQPVYNRRLIDGSILAGPDPTSALDDERSELRNDG